MNPGQCIIVIGRQYGSGGRMLGQMLAQKLGIPYYDKELLRQAADSLGFRADLFEKSDERRSSRFMSLLGANYGASTYFTPGALHEGTLYKLQSDAIRSLMEKGPCVIVGRTADYIGRDLKNVISIFLHADIDSRIDRIIKRQDTGHPDTSPELEEWIKRKDAIRADYYNYYTGQKWGDATNYHLTIDTSNMSCEQTCELVELFINHRQ